MTILLAIFLIVAQPVGAIAWVSDAPLTVTEYSYVHQWGVEAYLAHDYLAGEVFKSLQPGDMVFADGQEYRVSEIVTVNPTAEEEIALFEQYYGLGQDRLILQTCDGGGFYFVIAEPTGEIRGEYSGSFVIERRIQVPAQKRLPTRYPAGRTYFPY